MYGERRSRLGLVWASREEKAGSFKVEKELAGAASKSSTTEQE